MTRHRRGVFFLQHSDPQQAGRHLPLVARAKKAPFPGRSRLDEVLVMNTTKGLFLAVLLLLLAGGAALALPPARVRAGKDKIVVSVAFPAAEFEAAGSAQLPSIADLPLVADAPGLPLLPEATYRIVLPPGAAVTGLKITGKRQELPGEYEILWAQPPRPLCGLRNPVPSIPPSQEVYGSDELYPAFPAAAVGVGFFRGYRIASIRLGPLQLRAKSRRALVWSEMTVALELGYAGGDGPSVHIRNRDSDIAELARITVNPEAAYEYGSPEKNRSSDEPWLVITTKDLRPAFERLVNHRTTAGLPAGLRTMESIRDAYPGEDDAAKVREAIRDAYQNHGTTFVLLGGDDMRDDGTPLVPIRHCPGYDNMPSDWYFGALDDEWDKDGDGTLCEDNEVDFYEEVHIGRATIDTAEEADRFIDKLLAYEAGLPEPRRNDLVFMGEKLDDSTYGDDAMEETAAIIPGTYAIEKLYARPETFTKANVISSLDRGPHMTNHLGHAGSDYVMGLGIGDVENLINETPFFSYSQGCYAGAFDQGVSGNGEAISEHFLTTEHAAFADVMNGRYGWYCVGNPTCLSQRLDHEFWDALFTEGFTTLGEANDDARHDMASDAQGNHTMAYCFLETNLHGDPATAVQLERSTLVHASHRVVDGNLAYGNGNGVADPGETVWIPVTLRNEGERNAHGIEAWLSSSTAGVTVHDDRAVWNDIPAGGSAEDSGFHFSATLDLPCGGVAGFRLEVHHDDGAVDTSVFDISLGTCTDYEIRHDDFETDSGWISGGDAKDGGFVRSNPHGVTDSFSGQTQPEDDQTSGEGVMCWVTGNPEVLPGFDPHTGEVDRGTTFIESPLFDGTGEGALELRFARFVHRTGVAALNAAYYRALASNDGGNDWVELERLDANASHWTLRELALGDLLEPTGTMRLRFEAVESIRMPGDPLLEALIDEVEVFRRVANCEDFVPSDGNPPNPVGNTLSVVREEDAIRVTWQTPPEDVQHDAARFFPVYRSREPQAGFSKVAEPTEPLWRDRQAMEDARPLSFFYLVAARNAAGSSGEEPAP